MNMHVQGGRALSPVIGALVGGFVTFAGAHAGDPSPDRGGDWGTKAVAGWQEPLGSSQARVDDGFQSPSASKFFSWGTPAEIGHSEANSNITSATIGAEAYVTNLGNANRYTFYATADMHDYLVITRTSPGTTSVPYHLIVEGLASHPQVTIDVEWALRPDTQVVANKTQSISPGHTQINDSATFTTPFTQQRFYFFMKLFVTVKGDLGLPQGGVDFLHTLSFYWDLPAGISIASESGLFPGSVVPAPGAGAALLATVGIAGLRRRRD